MADIITGDGRVFKEDKWGHGTYTEQGGKGAVVSAKELAQYGKYTGVKIETIKESHKNSPAFTEMMLQKSKYNKR